MEAALESYNIPCEAFLHVAMAFSNICEHLTRALALFCHG